MLFLLAVLVSSGAVLLTANQAPRTPSSGDADGTTALHWAVRANDLETVQRLLRGGASPNVANRNGVTPLLLAAINADAVMVETPDAISSPIAEFLRETAPHDRSQAG